MSYVTTLNIFGKGDHERALPNISQTSAVPLANGKEIKVACVASVIVSLFISNAHCCSSL